MKKLTLLIAILLATTTFAQVPNYVPTNGLVGWWPFNGNANDESGNGNNGTVNGAILTSDRNSVANQAYSFDGSTSYIYVPFSSSINSIQSGITMSAWILMDGGTGAGTPPRIMELRGAYGNGGDAGLVMLAHDNSNIERTFEVRWHNNFGNTNVSINPTNSVPSLTWHHVLFSADGLSASGKFYLDGILINTNANEQMQGVINACNYNNNPLIIGAESNLIGKWGGKLDDIGIWNRALSACEIKDLYYSQLGSTNSTSSETQTALDNYTWPLNNQTYTHSGTYSDTLVNAAGCDSIVTLNLTLNYTGINENNSSSLVISPNPTTGSFSLHGLEQLGTITSLRINDNNGKIVQVLDPKATQFACSSLKTGVYFLEVISSTSIEIIKLIKE
jgi:hypothetical protein